MKPKLTEYWSAHVDAEQYDNGPHASIDDAIYAMEVEWLEKNVDPMHLTGQRKSARYLLPNGLRFSVAEREDFNVGFHFLDIEDRLMCQANDACGDASEVWEIRESEANKKRLTDALDFVLRGWLEQTGNMPTCFGLANIKTFEWDADQQQWNLVTTKTPQPSASAE